MVLYYVFTLFMGTLGLEHHLFRFADAPSVTYSDMNRYGHFLRPVFWFDAYWAACTLLVALAVHLFWVRGLESALRPRLAIARQRFTPRLRTAAVVVLVLFSGLGGLIYYNTNVLNHYQTSHD